MNDFVRNFFDWAAANPGHLQRIYSQVGGWEGWAQVELAMAIEDGRFGVGGSVAREAHVYKDEQQRADIEITHIQKPENPAPRAIIELKCQSLGQDENKHAFGQAIGFDIYKIQKPERKVVDYEQLWFVIGIGLGGPAHPAVAAAIDLLSNEESFPFSKDTYWTWRDEFGPTVFYAIFN